ncbi:hypothetical protein BJ878DRAFT_546388 [Calycina marina]|uniref:Ysc84 actin-binding domain-containing protein n=1 Tax=Calycina marina TaxID=1763456 RepID=A0A9P7YV86_9HELO|nr:hypothetical protein BJ878DRAFT_546388 [Calycina marina]
MQKVTAILPSWDKSKTTSKTGFDKGWKLIDKLGAPVNKFSNKIGSEAFWPTSMGMESDKAARILRSFCKDGFYVEEDRPTNQEDAKGKQRVLKKIPQKVIQNAVGLAIFTTMRTGLWVSGAGGSGVLIARKEDNTWSPPSGILLHTAGLDFLAGVDIYDCVVVINNRKALGSFTKIRATFAGEISAIAGPVGIGGVLEGDGKCKDANCPVFTYLKSRGSYAGVQVDGIVIIERSDENERFYGERIGVADIVSGKVRHPPHEVKLLMETVKAAEGRADVDQRMLDSLNGPAPADNEISLPTVDIPIFGIPEVDDPDPFGVLALEKEGLEIREAGTKERPPSTQFEFNPSPTSPVYSKFHRRSMDTLASRSNRESYMSIRSTRTRNSIDRATQTETGTQTEDTVTPITSPTHSSFDHARIIEEDEMAEKEMIPSSDEVDYTKIDLGPYNSLNHSQEFEPAKVHGGPYSNHSQDPDCSTATSDSPYATHEEIHADSTYVSNEEDFDDDEEPVVFEAAEAQATIITPKVMSMQGGMVTIPKRGPPPPLPPRSNARSSRGVVGQSSGCSPTKEGFEEVELHGVDRKSEERRRSHIFEKVLTPPTISSDSVSRSGSPKGLGIILQEAEEPGKVAEPTRDSTSVASEVQTERLILLIPQSEKDTFHSVPNTCMDADERTQSAPGAWI